MVLITYTPGPAARPELYEPWLRDEDNPTFNRIPGIAEYSNWKLRSAGKLPCTHFDFLCLARLQDLERVWFSPELDSFRARWVDKWGYGSAGPPSVASSYATLFVSNGPPLRARERFVRLDIDPPAPAAECWQATEALRKHWAIGRAPSGQKWRIPVSQFNPLGCSAMRLTFHARLPEGIAAECVAAPSMAWQGEQP